MQAAPLNTDTAAAEVFPEAASLSIHLHPLVLLSVSDHVTRMRYLGFYESQRLHRATGGDADVTTTTTITTTTTATSSGSHTGNAAASGTSSSAEKGGEVAPVLGILLGQERDEGGAVEVVMSFEVVFIGADGNDLALPRPPAPDAPTPAVNRASPQSELQRQRRWFVSRVDWDAVQQKRERLREVFPECSVVGWYTVGASLGDIACCAAVHEHVCRLFGGEAEEEGNDNRSSQGARGQWGVGSVPEETKDEGATAGGRMLALMLEAEPRRVASAALPAYMFEVLLERTGTTTSTTEEAEEEEHNEEDGTATTKVARRSAGLPRTSDARLSLTIPLPTRDDASERQASRATEASRVRFTPVRFLLESEEMEHVAIEAALNIHLSAGEGRPLPQHLPQQQRDTRGTTPADRAAEGPTAKAVHMSVVDRTLAAQALHRGAALQPNIMRTRNSLLLLRRRVVLAAAYLDGLLPSSSSSSSSSSPALSHDGNAETIPSLTHMDAEALRQLNLVASQLPSAPSTGTSAVTAPTLRTASNTTTHTSSTRSVLAEETESAVVTALLAMTSQAVLGTQALKHSQESAWIAATNFAASRYASLPM